MTIKQHSFVIKKNYELIGLYNVLGETVLYNPPVLEKIPTEHVD